MNKNTTTTIDIPIGTKSVNINKEKNKILIEFVPIFKNGDFLYSNVLGQEDILIFKEIHDGRLYFHVCLHGIDDLDFYPQNYYTNIEDFRLATEVEKQQLLYMMQEGGKKWNAEKLCIEDIPQRKFKPGDKVKLKDGVREKREKSPYFVTEMEVCIGKVLTVASYTSKGNIYMKEGDGWEFAEDWLEPYSDEPIFGELAIFWDELKEYAVVKIYERFHVLYSRHTDHNKTEWIHAIKFESKEQYERLIKGEL